MINLRGAPPVSSHHNHVCTNIILHFAGEGLIAEWATQICQSVRPSIENNYKYQ